MLLSHFCFTFWFRFCIDWIASTHVSLVIFKYKYVSEYEFGYEIGRIYTAEQTTMWHRIKLRMQENDNEGWVVVVIWYCERGERRKHGRSRGVIGDERVDTCYHVSSSCKNTCNHDEISLDICNGHGGRHIY